MSLITPDSGLLIWMTLIFAIVFFLLAKFGFPMITGMVDKRSEKIQDSIEKAKEAEERLASLADEQARMIEETRMEQSRILKEASDARDKIIANAKDQARVEADKMVSQARERIATERENALRDIRQYVTALSIGVAEKIVRKDLGTDEAQKALIDRMVEEMEHGSESKS